MTISREQHFLRASIRRGIIAAMRDNLDDEFTAAEICEAMTSPPDRDPRQVGANLKIMAADGLVATRPQQNIHVYRLLPAALDWTPPAFQRAPKAKPVTPVPVGAGFKPAPTTPPPAPEGPMGGEYPAALPATPPAPVPAPDKAALAVPPPIAVPPSTWHLAEPDQPIETPLPAPAPGTAPITADYAVFNPPFAWHTDVEAGFKPARTADCKPAPAIPARWMADLRLRLHSSDDREDRISLKIMDDGGGYYCRVRANTASDLGELDFLPLLVDGLMALMETMTTEQTAPAQEARHAR